MNPLELQMHGARQPDTILHLGAGLCTELSVWCRSGARRIILVEPNPELLPELSRRTQGLEQVEIIAAAVSPEAGQCPLRLFNFPLLNSLREPTGLNQVLPGLKQLGQTMVDCLPLDQLLEQKQIDSDETNWLMIDAPGEESEIFAQLEQTELLHAFSRIFLNAGVDSLYRGAESADAIVSAVQRLGFELAAEPDESDADWVRQHLRLNLEAWECQQLRRQVADLNQQHEAEKAVLEQKNAESVKALEQEMKRAAAESQQLKQLRDEQEKRIGSLEAERDDAQQKLQHALSELDKARSEKDTETEQLSAERADLQQQLGKMNADLEKQQSDVSVALKLQMLRETDLKELQQRYGKLQETNKQQRELLGKLHQRLSAAAEYLSLSDESDSDNNQQVADLVRALTGEAPNRE